MSKAAAEQQNFSNPLEELGTFLDADMRAVNALIIQRMDSPVKLIPQLATYLVAAGGKRVRPLLTLASTAIYQGDMARAHRLAAAVEFIHTATLLHDDVVDESEERRGQDAANLVFGNQASVLVGDFLFARAFQLMTEDGSLEVLRILSEASAVIAQGEVLQLTTTNNLNTGMDDYIEVIKSKTAALFAAACEVGPVIAGASAEQTKAMADFGMNMGIAFQIADDTLDYLADPEKLGKALGDDFREGKMTAPVLLALEAASKSEREFWQRTLGEKNQNAGDLEQACATLKKHKIKEKCLQLANDYKDQAISALQTAPQGHLQKILEELTEYTITRKF